MQSKNPTFAISSATLQGIIWLLASTMTMLVGVALAPALPGIRAEFSAFPNAEWLAKMALGAPSLTIGLVSFPIGLWLNRHSRRRTFLIGLAGCGILGLSGFFIHSLVAIVALRIAMGLTAAMALVTASTMIGDFFQGKELNRWIGLQTFAVGIGGIAYLPLAGFLASYHWRWVFAMYSVPLVLFGLAFLFVKEIRRAPVAASSSSPLSNPTARPGANTNSAHTNTNAVPKTQVALQEEESPAPKDHPLKNELLLVYGLILYCGLAYFAIPAHLPFTIQDRFGLGPKSIGFALGLNWVGFSCSSLACGIWKDAPSRRSVQIAMYLLMCIGFLALASAASWSVILIGVFLIGAGLGMTYPYMGTNLMRHSSGKIRGAAVGIYTACNFGSQFLSPLITHPLVKWIGISGVYIAIAASFLILSLHAWKRDRTSKEALS